MAYLLTLSPKQQFIDANGEPVVGGKLYTYAAGTTTPLASYVSKNGATNANPIILDTRGEANIWLTSVAYKFALYTSADVLVWTVDDIIGAVGAGDLAGSSGSSLIGFIQAGSGAVATTVQTKLRERISAFDFMTSAQVTDVIANTAVTNLAAAIDVTIPLQNAYAAANAAHVDLYLPQGGYKITSLLTWGHAVNVYGVGTNYTIIVKSGAGSAISVTSGGGQVTYKDFAIYGDTTDSDGLNLVGLSYARFENLFIYNHGGNGIYVDATASNSFANILINVICSTNGSDGISMNGTGAGGVSNVWKFIDVHCTSNTGTGFRQFGAADEGYHTGNMTCENNAGGGLRLEGIGSSFVAYLENNTGFDLQLQGTATNNFITAIASNLAYQDKGTGNYVLTMGSSIDGPSFHGSTFGAPRQTTTGTAGKGASFSSGAGELSGGLLQLFAGAATAGNAAGGDVYVYGGAPAGSGNTGVVYLQPTGTTGGVPGVIYGQTSAPVSSDNISFYLGSVTQVPMAPRLTNTNEAALTAKAGMFFFNTTTGKFRVCEVDGALRTVTTT